MILYGLCGSCRVQVLSELGHSRFQNEQLLKIVREPGKVIKTDQSQQMVMCWRGMGTAADLRIPKQRPQQGPLLGGRSYFAHPQGMILS